MVYNNVSQYTVVPLSIGLVRGSGTDDSGATPVEEYVQQPYEDWTSSPSHTTTSSSLSRGRSIKALVQRFEELDSSHTPTRLHSSYDTPGLHAPVFKQTRRTSPLRQSIRNFVSVFKRARRDKDEPIATSYAVVEEYPMPNKHPGSSFCASPPSLDILQSGTVLHLSPPDGASAILPVWTQYHAELHARHVLLTFSTAHGLPVSKVLSLAALVAVANAEHWIFGGSRPIITERLDPIINPGAVSIVVKSRCMRGVDNL